MANNPQEDSPNTLIVGISGPSSSGKTTLARLLQRIFSGVNASSTKLNTFIIHEDDFYYPDDKIPYTTLPSGKQIQDWDTVNAIDTSFLAQSLSYVSDNGHLPPRLSSKEDQNEEGDPQVDETIITELRNQVRDRIRLLSRDRSIAFMEGFLLYAPPLSDGDTEDKCAGSGKEDGNDHPLRKVQDQIHLPLFLPAPYSKVKARREGRTGYVTIGPDSNQPKDQPPPGEGNVNSRPDVEVDLEEEGGNEVQNFWVDPPGYVDDIVWPRYVGDHSWLIIPDHPVDGDGEEEFIRAVGEGVNVRHDVGLKIAPGMGVVGMDVVLGWAVEEILKSLESSE